MRANNWVVRGRRHKPSWRKLQAAVSRLQSRVVLLGKSIIATEQVEAALEAMPNG
jgi:hypothetical protein